MAREGLMDDCGYEFFECDGDCAECGRERCANREESEEEE